MASLNEHAICLIASSSGVNMASTAKSILYTVPAGKTFYPFAVCVREASSSLSGGIQYDFGVGASCTGWVQNVDLSNMAASADFRYVTANYNAQGLGTYQDCVAGSEFGVKGVAVASSAVTVTMDVFGFVA